MQKFSFASSARLKMVDSVYGARKTCQFFNVSVVLPPSGKISAGAHVKNYMYTRFIDEWGKGVCRTVLLFSAAVRSVCVALRRTGRCTVGENIALREKPP